MKRPTTSPRPSKEAVRSGLGTYAGKAAPIATSRPSGPHPRARGFAPPVKPALADFLGRPCGTPGAESIQPGECRGQELEKLLADKQESLDSAYDNFDRAEADLRQERQERERVQQLQEKTAESLTAAKEEAEGLKGKVAKLEGEVAQFREALDRAGKEGTEQTRDAEYLAAVAAFERVTAARMGRQRVQSALATLGGLVKALEAEEVQLRDREREAALYLHRALLAFEASQEHLGPGRSVEDSTHTLLFTLQNDRLLLVPVSDLRLADQGEVPGESK